MPTDPDALSQRPRSSWLGSTGQNQLSPSSWCLRASEGLESQPSVLLGLRGKRTCWLLSLRCPGILAETCMPFSRNPFSTHKVPLVLSSDDSPILKHVPPSLVCSILNITSHMRWKTCGLSATASPSPRRCVFLSTLVCVLQEHRLVDTQTRQVSCFCSSYSGHVLSVLSGNELRLGVGGTRRKQ